jgi:hypothetical protein
MSSGNIRIVKYNEDLFKVPSKTQKRKKPDKPIKLKTEKKVSNKTIKNSILKEIRKNQEKQYNSLLNEPTVSTTNEFENDFKNSVDFMKKIAEKQRETKANQTIKNYNASVQQPVVQYQNTDLIPVHLDEDIVHNEVPMHNAVSPYEVPMHNAVSPYEVPMHNAVSPYEVPMHNAVSPYEVPMHNAVSPYEVPIYNEVSTHIEPSYAKPMQILPRPSYGCLKNGSLPTYRSYHNRTMKVHEPLVPVNNNFVSERIKSPAELLLIEKLKQREIEKKSKNQIVKQKKYKKLLRRTYRCGKDRYKPNVGVLLPNKTIRSNVTTKSYLLKQTPIDEIRKTLVKQGFIKVGSSAPNDVLRKIYESIQMIDGDIKNHNPDNLLYNFFNDKNK